MRFFRIAYGAARPDQHISEREARNILSQMHGAGRLTVDWLLTGDLPRHHVKSAFLIIACDEAALPMGGHVTIAQLERGPLTVGASGPRILQDLSGLALLNRASYSTPSPREVQFLILLKKPLKSGLRFPSASLTPVCRSAFRVRGYNACRPARNRAALAT